MNAVHFSSARHDWATPQAFFDALEAEFGFTLDACALPENAKVARFFTPEDDALAQHWSGVVWMNPPYGYGIGRWIRKAYLEAQRGAVVVGLVPARTETAWWHDYAMRAAEIRLVRGRLMFGGTVTNPDSHNAPFPSAVVIWRQGNFDPVFTTMDRGGAKPQQIALPFAVSA